MKRLLIFALLPVFFLAGCVKSLEDYNVDTKKPAKVAAAPLVSNAIKAISDWQNSVNVNTNVFRFYAQHMSATTYLDEPRYDMVTRTIPQALWNGMYVSALADLKDAARIINDDKLLNAEVKKNQLAIIDIVQVYAFSYLVNTFGDIPYTEALDINNPQPKFDDAKTITTDLLNRLATSVGNLNEDADGFTSGDILYSGDISKWIKFGNSIRLRIALLASDADQGLASSHVAAAAANAITANADNALVKYLGAPNNNPLSNDVPPRSSRKDFVAANTLVDIMNARNDSRRDQYFTSVNGAFVGGRYGFQAPFAENSTFSSKVIATTLAGDLMDAAEVNFMLAEAVERGFISGSAQDYYNAGIAASFAYWGASGATDYIAQDNVNYTNAASGATWRDKIGMQKWIAMFNRGWEAWTSWRQFRVPNLLPPDAPNVGGVPVRMIYPIVENTLNKSATEAAAAKIGGDSPETKLWWDKN